MHLEVVGRAYLPPRLPTRITVMSDSDGSPKRDDRHHRRSRSRSSSPVSPDWAGETPAEREEQRLAEAAVPVRPRAGQPRAASADTGPWTQEPEPAEVTAPIVQTASPAAPPRERAPDARGAETAAPASHGVAPTAAPGTPPTRGVAPAQEPGASPRAAAAAEGSGEGARGVGTAAPASGATASAGHAAAPSTPRKRGADPARATGSSPAAAAAAAVGREGAKYRVHANPTHTRTSPPKPFPVKLFPPGLTRHVRPQTHERSPPVVTLPQLQMQGNAWHVIQEGGDGAQAEQRASQRSAERGTGGDRRSAQGHAQGAGQGTRGKEQGRKHGRGTEASSSGGGQSAGSGRRDKRQGAEKGPGHGKGAQGRGQGARVHGAGRGPKGKGKGATGPESRQDRALEPGVEGGSKGGGRGAGRPRSRTCSR